MAEDDVTRVKNAANIVDVIGEFVDLKRAGKNYKGLCPFHKEKTPSFVVSEERGTYKCFGCGEYGDVFSFLMKRDNMTFPQALEYLADKTGITLNNTRTNRKRKSDFEKYYRINEDARKFFYQNLLVDKRARSYLRKREIKDYTINEFSLGYAPDSWNRLLNYMLSRGYKAEDLKSLGLVARSQKAGNYYDVYRDRLIFPIYNIRGRVIAFGGRTLGEDRAKYINSPESLIYHKGSQLYGLNLVHQTNKRDRIILVEGYMDVVGLSQAGVDNVVAGLGTALTEDQARLANRYAKQIYLCYDSDSAGIKASLRAIETLTKLSIYPKIISLGEGRDPDDFIKEYGLDAFEEKIRQAKNHLDYQIGLILDNNNKSDDPAEMKKTLLSLAEIIRSIDSDIIRDEYIDKIAKKTGINPLSLASDLRKLGGEDNLHIKQTRREEKGKSLPKTLLICLIFSIASKESFTRYEKYLKDLDKYGLGYIYDYLKSAYSIEDRIDFEEMAEELKFTKRQAYLLSRDRLTDEDLAQRELEIRLKRFDLKEEEERLRNEISMLSSIIDKNPNKEEELKEMINRLREINLQLKAQNGLK